MRMVFRAVVMMVGVLLLAGVIAMVLLNQVLAEPMRTAPFSPEDLAVQHDFRDTSASAPQS